MFVLLAGAGVAGDKMALERMAAALRGRGGAARLWSDPFRAAAAAALPPDFLPEDSFDSQPLAGDGRVFVCQARLDNRGELLDRLRLAADSPMADSALLAAAYDRWGEDCVQEVVGDFAFAARHRDGRVVAAVDPLGARRMLWARIGNGIALSAQLPALLAHPALSLEPDFEALAKLLDSAIDRTTTPFAAVRSLPGGHRLVWRSGEARIERWWRPEASAPVRYRDPGDYVDETRELLGRAVAAHLRSSGPVSTTLSGGLDSGCVTALAARLLAPGGTRLAAYTSVPEEGLAASERPNWEPDDRLYAARVAELYDNIDHHLVSPGRQSAIAAAERVHRRSLTPVKATTNLLWLHRIADLAEARGSRVLLMGQHGNAAFSWRGGSTVWELAALGRPRDSWVQAGLEARARGRGRTWILAAAARDGLRTLSRRTAGEDIGNPGLHFIAAGYRERARRRGNEYALQAGSRAFWAGFATTPRHSWSPEPVLQWGVELRDPTADRRLIERLLAYPQAAFRIGGRHRGLAREVAVGLLPDEVRLRTTHGAQVPEAPSLIAAHSARYRAALARMRGSAWCRELLDLDAIEGAFAGFVRGSGDFYLALILDRAFGLGLFVAEMESGL
ncbi:MAG TPA: asparagine synthase-related protein [Allosphingosinicella sp.]|jgi:asparagine synthase (glutamine-hydrolysing)